MCGGNFVMFDFVSKNKCMCEFAKEQALFITMKLHEKSMIDNFSKKLK